jgi:two-component system cell cycle response regulator DivK
VKILYVEDNDDNVYVVKTRLSRAGYTVLVAVDGQQGLDMALAERPDLILMDLSLPVLDGWEATRRLKATAETTSIPVIARRRSRPAVTTTTPSRSSSRDCGRRSTRS